MHTPHNSAPHNTALECENLSVGYGSSDVLTALSAQVPQGCVTALIGPNGSGKSTLLKAFGRQITPRAGRVSVRGYDLGTLRSREFARLASFLPQQPVVPEGVSVRELISFGRYPHTGMFASLSRRDHALVAHAAARTGIDVELDTPAHTLSGGQRQRAWIAMALAQEADIMLLDEPTTFLDPAHQLAVLHLIRQLCSEGHTIVMVIHDMTHAARFADYVVALKEGAVTVQGPTHEVMTPQLIEQVFGVSCLMVPDPATGRMLPVPYESRE